MSLPVIHAITQWVYKHLSFNRSIWLYWSWIKSTILQRILSTSCLACFWFESCCFWRFYSFKQLTFSISSLGARSLSFAELKETIHSYWTGTITDVRFGVTRYMSFGMHYEWYANDPRKNVPNTHLHVVECYLLLQHDTWSGSGTNTGSNIRFVSKLCV